MTQNVATRCHPGTLAEIIHSEAGNERRRVVVERAPQTDAEIREGRYFYVQHCGPLWIVQPLQPLRVVGWCIGGQPEIVALTMERCVFPDAWLRPIGDEGQGAGIETARELVDLAEGVAHD